MTIQNNEDVIVYALQNHILYPHVHKQEFLEDYKNFKIVARQIIKNGISENKKQVICNNIITLINLFGYDTTKIILSFMLGDTNEDLDNYFLYIKNTHNIIKIF
jgi:hypothetical protein